jgi:hypothetical protein
MGGLTACATSRFDGSDTTMIPARRAHTGSSRQAGADGSGIRLKK